MPCNSGQEYDRTDYDAHRQIDKLTAMLCGVMTILERTGALQAIAQNIDMKESAVYPSELMDWWEKHKRVDEVRRQLEAKAALDAQKRHEAIGKLTPEERRLLGLRES